MPVSYTHLDVYKKQGMAWVAEHHLAAAVSEAGGLGLIGGANAPAEVVREEIRLSLIHI